MNKIAVVAWREFIETVRTRAFVLGVVLMPGMIVAILYAGDRFSEVTRNERIPTRTLAIIDGDGPIYPELLAQIEALNHRNPQQPFALTRADEPEEALRERVLRGDLYGYFVVPQGVMEPPAMSPWQVDPATSPECRLVRRDSQIAAARSLRYALNEAVASARLKAHDPPLDPARIHQLQAEVVLNEVDVRSGEITHDDKARVIAPFLIMFLIYMATLTMSMGLLTSVLEEKNTRVMEVLLSAISPFQLMAGKILGVLAVGLVTLGVWIAVGYLSARSFEMEHVLRGPLMGLVALYFFPALLFSSALLAAVGSACNTLKEAQSMSSPLTLFNIVPVALFLPITMHADSTLSLILSFIPPITPFVMILRVSSDPATPTWQIVATLALMWLSVIAAFWAAAKVFRIGVLMYGQPPTLRELARWVRYA